MNESPQKSPTVSVIIPVYNGEKTITKTIDSVLRQTFADFELIVINDGSQDSSLESISQFDDSRLKVFSFENAGANVSRNRGLNSAVGEFVSFLDADDIWTPDKLARQLQALQENPTARVAYSWTDYIDENDQIIISGSHITANGNIYEKLLVHNFIENGSNPLIYKEALLEVGGFDVCLKAGQDWDMWLRLADKFNFVAVSSVQILYRITANSVSSNLIRQEKFCLQVLERAYKRRPIEIKHNYWHSSLANLYRYLTCKAFQEPLSRQKGLVTTRFLWKYILYDSSRIKHMSLTVKLLFKVIVIILLPTNLSTLLLRNIKTTVAIITQIKPKYYIKLVRPLSK